MLSQLYPKFYCIFGLYYADFFIEKLNKIEIFNKNTQI